jgi:hypothetical protein
MRLYYSAIGSAHFDPSGAYSSLVAALETLAAHHYKDKSFSFSELTKYDPIRPTLDKLRSLSGTSQLVEELEQTLAKNESAVSRKLRMFVAEFLPDEFWTSPDELRQGGSVEQIRRDELDNGEGGVDPPTVLRPSDAVDDGIHLRCIDRAVRRALHWPWRSRQVVVIVEHDGLIVESPDAEQRHRVADEDREEDGKVERHFVHGRATRDESRAFDFPCMTHEGEAELLRKGVGGSRQDRHRVHSVAHHPLASGRVVRIGRDDRSVSQPARGEEVILHLLAGRRR